MSKPPENPRKALGKGLSALIASRTGTPAEAPLPATPSAGAVANLAVDVIDPNPVQPRTTFNAERLAGLAQSLKTSGMLQPLLVRSHGQRYQLVAGERRWRAARLAGLKEVPALIQDISDDRLLETTLVENIQREDLNLIETAQAFERLSREFGLTHEEIARRTGKDRATITNLLRLLKLPRDVQQLLAEHRLSMGHAKAILGLPDDQLQRRVAEKVASQGLSVRQVERLVQRMTATREPGPVEAALEDPNVKAAVEELERVLGTRVRIVARDEQRGRIEIEYYSGEDLQRIWGIMAGSGA
jgi:ParB family chromosome partitioning protein